MVWKKDADGNWGEVEETPPQVPATAESQQYSTTENQENASLKSELELHEEQEDELSEKKQPQHRRWVLDSQGAKKVFVVENLPPVPKVVIPLPDPPSDAGSAFQSDSSLTASLYTAEGNGRSPTFEDIEQSGHSHLIEQSAHSHILDSDNEGDEADDILDNTSDQIRKFENISIDKPSTTSISNQSNGSTDVGTADMTDDLEGQGYPPSIFRPGTMAKKTSINTKIQPKKRLTFMEPSKRWTEEKVEHYLVQEEIRKGKRREACCRKAVLFLVFLSILAIVLGGTFAALVHFGVMKPESINLDFLKRKPKPARKDTSSPDESDVLFETPLPTEEPAASPTLSPTIGRPTSPPTASIERTFITDTLSGQFRIYLPHNAPLEPPNLAVDWMAQELKSIGQGHFDYQYDNMGKFGQRFAILTTQYSLLGKDVSNAFKKFSLEEQKGVDECDWEGVTCDAYGRVLGLDFSDLDLSGKIPSEIRYLFKLENLDLSSNKISGSIPDEVYQLRNLKKLYLYKNELTGTISTYIGALDNLQYLHLSHNRITGRIPEQLRSYSNSVLNPMSEYLAVRKHGKKTSSNLPSNPFLRFCAIPIFSLSQFIRQ
jgi:hypothetical protein